MTTSIFIKLPKEWVNSTIDISISVYATVTIVDDSWDVRVETITSPGYWAFHFLPEYKQDLYELIERRCIENYATETLKQEDYVL
jgi:hypothetical protein